jgi:CRP/FNR family transcriptional regulator, cyclic AMP receptor protein
MIKSIKSKKMNSFDPQVFLDTAGVARKITGFRRGESIYSQGEAAESVMYVQKGGVKYSVVNGSGKEAVVTMFGPNDFFGDRCMAGRSVRMGTGKSTAPKTAPPSQWLILRGRNRKRKKMLEG